MKKILVIGRGLLGQALETTGWASNYELETASRSGPRGSRELDITQDRDVRLFFEKRHDYDAVLNTAAMTDVDACERNPLEARRVNALAVRTLARECARFGMALLHLSTNYVFSAQEGRPSLENDCPSPCSIYGLTKLEGEYYTLNECPGSIVVRTSWIFGGIKKGFISFFLEKLKSEEEISVAGGQISSAVYSNDLAEALGVIVEEELLVGSTAREVSRIYHVANRGLCTRYDMVTLMAKKLGATNKLMCLKDQKLKNWLAVRPAFSALCSEKYEKRFKRPLRSWRQALEAAMDEVK